MHNFTHGYYYVVHSDAFFSLSFHSHNDFIKTEVVP